MAPPSFPHLQADPRIQLDVNELCRTLLRQRARIAYLSIYRRLDRDTEEPCGTLQWEDALSFLDEDLLDPFTEELAEEDLPVELREVIGAWCWVRDTILGNLDGEQGRRETFRLRAMGPKGHDKVFGRNINVNASPDVVPLDVLRRAETPAPKPEAPEVGFDMPPLQFPQADAPPGSLVMHYHHLGAQYNHFGQMLLGFFHSFLSGQRALQQQSTEDVHAARKQVGELVSVLIQQNVARENVETQRQQLVQDAETTVRTQETVSRLVEELGSTARFVLGAKSLSPQAIKLLETLGSDPELLAAMGDPKIVALLEDPEERKNLVLLLRQATQLSGDPQGQAPEAEQPRAA